MSSAEHKTEITQKIAYALRTAADFAIRAADPEWCELVFVSFPDGFSKDVETVQIGAMPARAKVSGEVVRLYLHLDDLVCFLPMRDAVRFALEPFFVGSRQLTVHDTAEGYEVILRDDREINAIHDGSAKDDLPISQG